MSKPLSEFREVDIALGNPLRDKVYITRGVRLDAAQRNKILGAMSLATTTVLSCYLTIASVFQLGFSEYITNYGDKLLDATIIALSLLLLVFSVFEAGRKTDLRTHQLEENSRALAELHLKIESSAAIKAIDVILYNELVGQYSDILKKCAAHHTREDFTLFRLQNPHLFPAIRSNVLGRFWLRQWTFAKVYGPYVTTMVAFPLAIGAFVWTFRDVVFVALQ